jgi:hypothetical protein
MRGAPPRLLVAAGRPALHLLWIAAWLTSYSLVMRVRSIAEHAMIPGSESDVGNTRTGGALVGAAADRAELRQLPPRASPPDDSPALNLPRMLRLLCDRGVVGDACVTRGYPGVLALAASRAA